MAQASDKRPISGDEVEEVLLPLSRFKSIYVMLILYLLFFLDFATRTVISPIYPVLKREMGLSDPQLGMLSTIILIMITVFSIPLSYLVDRWRRGKLASIMGIVWSFSVIGSGFSANFGQLLFTRSLLGVGESSFASAAIALIGAMFKKAQQATMIGIFNTAASLGGAFGMVIGGAIAVKYGWRMAFFAVGIPGLIIGILAWFLPDYKNSATSAAHYKSSEGSFIKSLKTLTSNKTLMAIYAAFGLQQLTVTSVMFWTPSYFNRYLGMDITKAGTVAGAMVMTALISAPLGGFIADRWSKRDSRGKLYWAFIGSIATSIFYLLGFYFNSLPLMLLGCFMSPIFVAGQIAASQEVVPERLRATSYGGYILSQYLLGGLWGPVLTGIFSQAFNLRIGFGIIFTVSLLGSFIYLVAVKYYHHDHDAARMTDARAASAGIEL